MHPKNYALYALMTLLSAPVVRVSAQVPAFISGEVIEKGTDKHLPGAVITLAGERIGTKADARGYFRLDMMKEHPTDTLELMVAGYQALRVPVERGPSSGWITAALVKKSAPLSRNPSQDGPATQEKRPPHPQPLAGCTRRPAPSRAGR